MWSDLFAIKKIRTYTKETLINGQCWYRKLKSWD